MATKEDVEAKLQEAYDLLKKDANHIPERMYTALEGISSVFYAWRVSGGKKGWSSSLRDPQGKALFTKQQQVLLEEAFNTYGSKFAEILNDQPQSGGAAASMSNIKTGPTSNLVRGPPVINPEDVSLDKLYTYVTTTVDRYDEQMKAISEQLGVVKTVEAQDYKGALVIPTIPPIPVPYYILGKTIFPFLTLLLDMIRIGLGNPYYDIPMARVSLSITLAVLDLLRGDWQNALLSTMGVFSPSGVLIGTTGKFIRNAWLFIAPDLQRQLRDDIYRSSKSMLIGFLLWSFSIFSPDAVRLAVNTSFEKMKETVEQFNQKSQDAEDKAQQVAEKAGVKVTFPKIPLTLVPTMDDLQNLQVIARVPEVYCSPEVQKILQPVLLVPPLRLVVELLNIPTIPEMVKEQCKAVDTSGLSKAIADKVTPTIDVLPGGPLDKISATASAATNAVNKAKKSVENKVNSAKNSVNAIKTVTGKTRRRKRRGSA